MLNKEIRFASRPAGMPTLDNFKTVDTAVPELNDGEVLVRTLYISVDPYLRGGCGKAAPTSHRLK